MSSRARSRSLAAAAVAGQCSRCGAPKAFDHSPGVDEPSGISASLVHPGVYYVISDSPRTLNLFAFTDEGKLVGNYSLTGVEYPPGLTFGKYGTGDLEALTVGPCAHADPDGERCVFVGDIGHNCVREQNRTGRPACSWFRPRGLYSVLRFREPSDLGQGTLHGERLFFRFPANDGPWDVETLLVTPHGELYLVTKVNSGPSGLYRIPPLRTDRAVVAQRLAEVRTPSPGAVDEVGRDFGSMVTDGGVRHNGTHVLGISLLTYTHVHHYSAVAGRSGGSDGGVDVQASLSVGEPCSSDLVDRDFDLQLEGFTWLQDAAGYVMVGEACGGRSVMSACDR